VQKKHQAVRAALLEVIDRLRDDIAERDHTIGNLREQITRHGQAVIEMTDELHDIDVALGLTPGVGRRDGERAAAARSIAAKASVPQRLVP
jgi:hypothetical protein